MQTITTIGLDIAKSGFQVHGVDAGGPAVIRRQLKRRYVLAFFQKLTPCLVGIEACASAHHFRRTMSLGSDTMSTKSTTDATLISFPLPVRPWGCSPVPKTVQT